MRPFVRRKLDIALIIAASIVVGVVAIIGSAAGDSERVATIWVDGQIASDGTLTVSEAIDYDFGLQSRRGIFRDVDDLTTDAPVTVSSETAPDEFVVFDESFGSAVRSRIRIGDPSVTITGRHRYLVGFPLTGLATNDEFGWDAVGTEWAVPIEKSEIRLRSERELLDVQCVQGDTGSWNPCDVETVGAATLLVSTGRLTPGQGVSLFARLGDAVAVDAPDGFLPAGPASDPGLRTAYVGLLGAVVALGGSIPVSRLIRRMGREKVHTGGSVAAAFGGSLDGVELVDHSDLAAMATTSFAPPDGISPAHGAIVFTESVQNQVLPAWLIERAIDDEISIEGTKDVTIRRGSVEADGADRAVLDKMFGNRQSIDLSKHDKKFTSGWTKLKTSLNTWQKTSDYWDAGGRVMQVRVRAMSIVGGIAALVLAAAGGAASARWGGAWPIVLIIGALGAGAAATSMVRSWELLVRSPEGSAAWIQIESFRRFLEGSEAGHVENAAAMGRLREYTAWAVALGETKAWTKSVDAAVANSPELGNRFASDLLMVHLASNISQAAARGSTPPRSSGGGGGGGFSGSVGGGGGGGGGGSW